jgi:predicted lysophospholipase L1 biosynthesis ABC-type transport system permease subunit
MPLVNADRLRYEMHTRGLLGGQLQREIRDLQAQQNRFSTYAFIIAIAALLIAAIGVAFGILTYYHVLLPVTPVIPKP